MRNRFGLLVSLALVTASANADSFVAYGPSIGSEDEYVVAGGHTVTLWDDTTWQAATAGDFAGFDAILVGENDCGNIDAPSGIWDNSDLWGPLVTGNVLMHSHDNHFCNETAPGGGDDCDENRYDIVTLNCAEFAGVGDGLGLCISIQCFSTDSHGATPFPLSIPGIGNFSLDDVSGDDIEIVDPLHPAMDGLTNGDLDCWGNSVHAHIQSYPSDFEVLAVDTASGECPENNAPADPKAPTGDGEPVEGPVTIARGAIEDIPTASEWGLGALAVLLAAGALVTLRRG